jgi:hypothetical protein
LIHFGGTPLFFIHKKQEVEALLEFKHQYWNGECRIP